jgi:hypothetical protein
MPRDYADIGGDVRRFHIHGHNVLFSAGRHGDLQQYITYTSHLGKCSQVLEIPGAEVTGVIAFSVTTRCQARLASTATTRDLMLARGRLPVDRLLFLTYCGNDNTRILELDVNTRTVTQVWA